jgi:predicted DNA-binding protein with PD1-like motif
LPSPVILVLVIRMEISRKGAVLMLRLDQDEDILGSIQEAVKNERYTLLVVTGLGMIHDFELGYFDKGKYLKKSFSEPHELLALQGSVASEGEPRIHIHATVANTKHEAFGGHLLRGKVWMSNEIGLLRLDGGFSKRVMDPDKKVGILHIE